MMIRQFIASGLVLAAVLIVVGYLLFLPASPLEDGASTAPKPVAGSPVASRIVDDTSLVPAIRSEETSLAGSVPMRNTLDTKETEDDILIRISEAMATYSEEGLPILEPYLTHNIPEVRSAAVEAIVQLAVPAGSEVLRHAARKTPNSEEQLRMLQGAEFLELPRLPLDQLRKLMSDGTVQLPAPAPPLPAAAPTVP